MNYDMGKNSALSDRLSKALLEAQSPDGGFGYLAGESSATEPTALASLALGLVGHEASRGRALEWLRDNQLPSGGWPARPIDKEESWAGALALLALAHDTEGDKARREGLRWLVQASGRPVKVNPAVFAIDGTVQGWSWSPGTFSWVEPTAFSILAIKKLFAEAGPEAKSRIEQGEALLINRMVDAGGWNYGNRRVYGRPYEAYPETTAVALLALQDHQDLPQVSRALTYLQETMGQGSPSGYQLSWALICLGAFGIAPEGLQARLDESYSQWSFFGRLPTLSAAILATSGPEGLDPFRLRGLP